MEVFAAACSGYASVNERLVIENRIVYWQPDVVIQLTGHNDAHWAILGRDPMHFRGYQDDYFFTLANSLLALNYDRSWPAIPAAGGKAFAIEETVARLLDNLALANFALRNSGARHFVVLQPTLSTTKKRLTPREDHWRTKESPQELAAYLHAFDRALVSQPDRPYRYRNLDDVFEAVEEDVFLDSCHFGDRGNDLIARELAELVAGR